jgi:protein TonB
MPQRPTREHGGATDNSPTVKLLRSFSTLQIALAVSLGLHAALLTVRFVAPEQFNRVFQDTPLEVILVNARSEQAPDKAQAIAQKSLAGGGDAEKGRATSPLPASAQARLGDALEDEERQVEALKEQQNRMLAQLRKQLAKLPPPDPKSEQSPQAAIEREQKRRALIQTLAEIERRINEENARPRKRYVSPATREAVYAIYYDELRHKIEERGTTNFPESGGRKLYGELTMVITVNHDGRVLDTEVVQPSGQALLDQRAQSIVRSLAFGRFTDAMRRRSEQIAVVSRFRFTRDQTLHTQMSTGQ